HRAQARVPVPHNQNDKAPALSPPKKKLHQYHSTSAFSILSLPEGAIPRSAHAPAPFANDTSNTATGSEKPLRKSGGSGLTFTSLLSSTLTALDTRICPTEALEQTRAAMFTTLPIAV